MSKNNKLLILSQDAASYAGLVERLGFRDLEFTASGTTADALKHAEGSHIILGEPGLIVPLLDRAKNLEWVQSTYAGVEALTASGRRTDYLLTNVKGVFGPLMSEYVFAHILALERRLLQIYGNQQNREWQDMPYRSLQGLLLGICGLGSIGRHIARTAKCFGMDVWGYKRHFEKAPAVDRVFTRTDFREFLAGPDYMVITLPHTPQNYYLFDGEAFQTMKHSAVLINVGRGKVVSEGALTHALKEKLIRGAVLDVFEEEPLPKESPLWGSPNVFITPHNAAFSFPEDIVDIFAGNYRSFTAGKPLRYLVDFERGY